TGHAGKTLELPELASPGPDALAFQLGVAPSLASDSTIALARNKAPVSYAPAALYSGPPADSASMPPQNRSKVPTGTILEGKFRVTKEIGRGGMAAVYEAENIDIGKRVAVKILAAELITSRVVRERFLREARAAAAIRSPHICDVYDSGMYDERPFLVMELLEGESLYD